MASSDELAGQPWFTTPCLALGGNPIVTLVRDDHGVGPCRRAGTWHHGEVIPEGEPGAGTCHHYVLRPTEILCTFSPQPQTAASTVWAQCPIAPVPGAPNFQYEQDPVAQVLLGFTKSSTNRYIAGVQNTLCSGTTTWTASGAPIQLPEPTVIVGLVVLVVLADLARVVARWRA